MTLPNRMHKIFLTSLLLFLLQCAKCGNIALIMDLSSLINHGMRGNKSIKSLDLKKRCYINCCACLPRVNRGNFLRNKSGPLTHNF